MARRITDAWLARIRLLLEGSLSSPTTKCKLSPADLYGIVVALQGARLEVEELRLVLMRYREAERTDSARRPTPARPTGRLVRPSQALPDDPPSGD